MSAAIFIDLRAICSALTLFSVISARAADKAKGPPEPIPINPSSGSKTSPLPDRMSDLRLQLPSLPQVVEDIDLSANP